MTTRKELPGGYYINLETESDRRKEDIKLLVFVVLAGTSFGIWWSSVSAGLCFALLVLAILSVSATIGDFKGNFVMLAAVILENPHLVDSRGKPPHTECPHCGEDLTEQG